VRGIAFTQFSSADVVRHPLVARIVDAYEHATSAQEIASLPKPVAVKNARKKS
jgi:phosphate starvation-inducible PhoH-like protein